MVVMESDERLNEKRLKRRTELRLRILAARHKKLQLQKWKITEKLPIEQKLKAADLKSFGIYYEKVFKKDLVDKLSSGRKRRSADVEDAGPPKKALKLSDDEASITASSDVKVKLEPSKPEEVACPPCQSSSDSQSASLPSTDKIDPLAEKIKEQEWIVNEGVFKYPRVPSSVSSNDVTPASVSPYKSSEAKQPGQSIAINKNTLPALHIKEEPSDSDEGFITQPVCDKPTEKQKESLTNIGEACKNLSSNKALVPSISMNKAPLQVSKSSPNVPHATLNPSSNSKPIKSESVSHESIVKSSVVTSSITTDQSVVERVNELKMSGMLYSKRLPKVMEPRRCKTHWDYLLSEMIWMHTDFYQEHLWKLNAARVLAEACRKFLIVAQDPSASHPSSHFVLPRDFILRRKTCRSVASVISSFWSDASKVLDIKLNLLEQENERRLAKVESDMDAVAWNKKLNSSFSPVAAHNSLFSSDKTLNKLNTDSLNEDIFVVATQLSADSDNSHISLGLDSAEMEKEVGHIMRMDDIFNESFIDAGSDKFSLVNKSPGTSSATSLPPVGWHPTPGDHVASLELKFLAVEKYALSLIELVYHGELLPLKDINYEADEDMLTVQRSMVEAEFRCVTDNEPMLTYFPPTPPMDENDVYIDESLLYLYKLSPMKESQLPPLPPSALKKSEDKKSSKDSLAAIPSFGASNEKTVIATPPSTLFNAFSPVSNSAAKSKSELLARRSQGVSIARPFLKSPNCPCKGKPVMQSMVNLDGLCEWLPNEDYALVSAILGVQQLPPDLTNVMPAITPNWDFVSVAVNNLARSYRSSKQSKVRYEKYIKPREEGRIISTEMKRKQKQNSSNPNDPKAPPETWNKQTKLAKTSQLLMQDMNNSATYVFGSKFSLIRTAVSRRTRQNHSVQWNAVPTSKNPRHLQSFSDCKINYDSPLTPQYLSEQRAIRLKSEKRSQNSAGIGSSKLVDNLFTGSQYTGSGLKRSQSTIIAPRTGGQSSSSPSINIPAALCRQYSATAAQRKMPVQSGVSINSVNQQRNTISYVSQSQNHQQTGSIRVVQTGETSSVAQKVTADYQRMILSNKQRDSFLGAANPNQSSAGQKQRIGQLIQHQGSGGVQQQSGSNLSSPVVYNIAGKGATGRVSLGEGQDGVSSVVSVGGGVRGVGGTSNAGQIAAKFGYIQPTGRASLAAQLTAQSGGNLSPSPNHIQMKSIVSSSSSPSAISAQYGNIQQTSSGGIGSNMGTAATARYATVVQRGNNSSQGVQNISQSVAAQIYSGTAAAGRIHTTGNLSTAAQLLGRQAIRKTTPNNSMGQSAGFGGNNLASPRNSPIVVPATNQVTSQLQFSSKQQHQSVASSFLPASSVFDTSNNSPSLTGSSVPPVSQIQPANTSAANLTSNSRRSAFVQPLPSVTTPVNNSNSNRGLAHQNKK